MKFPPHTLGIVGMKHLMGLSEEIDTLYASQFEDMIRTLPRPLHDRRHRGRGCETYTFQNKWREESAQAALRHGAALPGRRLPADAQPT